MGTRGPPPKRESQRRRRNKPDRPITKGQGAAVVEPPKGNSRWHPVAKRWFASLASSGQSAYFEPSDWATAELVAESISRDLRPQPIGVNDAGEPVMAELPIKGASLAAYLKAMTNLLTTEGDRRRAGLELDIAHRLKGGTGGEGAGNVSWLAEARRGRESG